MSTRTYRYCIFHGEVIFALNGEDKMRFPIPGRRRRGSDFAGPGDPVVFNEPECHFLRTVRTITFAGDPPLEEVVAFLRKREKVDTREAMHGWEKDVKKAEKQFLSACQKQRDFEERAKRVTLNWEDEHDLRDLHSNRVQTSINNWTYCKKHLLLSKLMAGLINSEECNRQMRNLPKSQEEIEREITSRRH